MNKQDQDLIIQLAMFGSFLTTYAAYRGAAQAAETIFDAASEAAKDASAAIGNTGKVVIDIAEAASNPEKTLGDVIAGGVRGIFK